MSLFINTNVSSLTAQNNLQNSQSGLSQSLERLSSGLRINSAADDAAGLAISTRMTSQINGLNTASQNANDGISLAQTAGGALTSVTSNLQTLRQLAVESANATNTSSDRAALNAQAQQLLQEIQNTATTTQFNGQNLLDGSFQSEQFQVGANANQTISVSVAGATTNTLGNYGGAATAAVSTTNAWAVGSSVIVNGVEIGASNATSAAGASATSAYARAAAINAQTGLTGVTATASTTTSGSSAITTGQGTQSGQLWVNGVAVGSISSATTQLGQLQNAANAINAVSSQSGVTALANASTGQLTLTAADGRDIDVATNSTAANTVLSATGLTATAFTNGGGGVGSTVTGGVASGGTGVDANGNLDTSDLTGSAGWGTTTAGTLTLNSSSSINLSQDAGSTALAAGGLTGYSSKLSGLNTLDISTVSGANAAINIVDAAINQVDGQQADLGAIQNRFTATISNLSTASTNLSSAQSLIEDTNYASETANLAHYQILQQAGTAMLAQANSLPNSVLTLLR